MNKSESLKSFVAMNVPLMVQTLTESDLVIVAKQNPDATIMMLDKPKGEDSGSQDFSSPEFEWNFINDLIAKHSNPMFIFTNINLYNYDQISFVYRLVVDKPCNLILVGDFDVDNWVNNFKNPLQSRCLSIQDS